MFMIFNVCVLQLSYIEDRIAPSASDVAQEVYKLSRHGVRVRTIGYKCMFYRFAGI